MWRLLGDVDHYVEPFAGTMAVLLERPHPCNRPYYSETVSDADGLLVNAWRGIQWHPDEVAEHASWPVSEADKQARQIACINWRTEKTLDLLAGSAEWCDPKIAGWWLYGVCCQIGAHDGPWTADPKTGRIVKSGAPGVCRDRPPVANNGLGVNHAGLRESGVYDQDEFHPTTMPELKRWMGWLSARLRHVRIINGDWARVCTTGVTKTLTVRQGGHCGVFIDPPYDTGMRDNRLYGHDAGGIADEVRKWCLASGDDRQLRIVLAGFDTEHVVLESDGWTVHEWFADGFLTGGMGDQQHRERLWASPHCLPLAAPEVLQFEMAFGGRPQGPAGMWEET